MKKFFSFIGRLFSVLALLGVAFYCVGFFFYSKTKSISDLFSKKEDADTDEE